MTEMNLLLGFSPIVQAAIRTATDLCGERPNREYLRGQVELICALGGLDSDIHRDEIRLAVMHPDGITWTFIGHWSDDKIIVTEVLDGQHEDDREDERQYSQGLWAASGTGFDRARVQAEVIGEYERAVR